MNLSVKKIAIISSIFYVGIATAQNGLSPKTAYLYTNGFAWIQSQGKVNVNSGSWRLDSRLVPAAVKGAFWFESPSGINYVLKKTDTVYNTVFQPGIAELLRINLNKNVSIAMAIGNSSTVIDGKIKRVFFQPDDSVQIFQSNPLIALIETSEGDIALNKDNLGRIISIRFGTDARYDVKERGIAENLHVFFRENVKSAELTMAYLTSHPGWDPVYRLQLNKNGKAVLTLGSEISSGSQDFKQTELNLVAGHPSFVYGGLQSRLSNYYAYENPGYAEAVKNVGYDDFEPAAVSRSKEAPEDVVNVNSAQSGDFYYYTIKNFSLQKNQSAYVEILKENVDVAHSYECTLNPVSMYGSGDNLPIDEAPVQPVFHFLTFKNPAKQNLVGAAVFVENLDGTKDIPSGQPWMEMVPVGGNARILLAQNPDIPVKNSDEELSRTANAHSIIGRNETLNFDLVKMKSTMRIENQGTEEKTVIIKRAVEGKPLTSEANWTIVSRKAGVSGPNPVNHLRWEIKLKPGETKNFTYTYEYYLRVY